jgi:hypothetical protein
MLFEFNNLGSSHESITNTENVHFESLVYKNAINLLSKWYNQSGVPRNKIQFIIDDFTSFLNDCLPYTKNKVKIFTQVQSSTTNRSFKLNTMLNILSDPFKTLNTEYLRFKAFDELGILIKPRAVTLGQRLNDKLENGHVIIESIPIKAYSVLLKILLKQLFEFPNVLNMMLDYNQKLLKDNSGIIHSFIQLYMETKN